MSRQRALVILLALAVSACQPIGDSPANPLTAEKPITVEQKATSMSETVTIKIGEPGAVFLKRYPKLINTYQSLPGLAQDYDIDWDVQKRGAVRLDHGEHSFTISHVLGLQTFEDLRPTADKGLTMFTLFAGLTNVSGISHDEARLKTYGILREIEAKGWKTLVLVGDPRVYGVERFNIALSSLANMFMGLDLRYVPNLQEWMKIEDGTPWTFYADGLYMQVSFRRSPEHMDPKEHGVYQLKFNIKTDTEYFRGFAGPDKRDQWKEVVPGELARLAKLRADKEAELRAKGIPIDESYQDPPVPTFK
jgi:hypothetical protein